MENQGITDQDVKNFLELLIKANSEQLTAMRNATIGEINKRKLIGERVF